MAENRIYLAIGEEAVRGVGESANVGFIPILNPGIPKVEFDEKKRKEFRGEDSLLGDTTFLRMSRRWNTSLDIPFFTEAGSTKGMAATLLKHFFGKASTGQNGATGQYHHMMSPVADPFSSSNLGTRALTVNLNINEGQSMVNRPFTGGRVKSLSLEQESGSSLKLTAGLIGQKREASTASINNPVFAAENLRCDYNNLKVYTGAITRVGSAPDYTGFTFAAATQIKPDKVSIKVENGMEDALRLSGVDYPDKTRMGQFKLTMDMTLDWEDPSSGFSSVAEFNNWVFAASSTNFFLHWDTGTQAGTGDNHGLYVDLPLMQRKGGDPQYKTDKDPMVTLKYEGLLDTANTGYLIGILLKNTAASV
ncbi:MAG: hypothetical protein HZB22_08025 [Deltaproteobacteria bacterium]|nr:hypothetical protein [Deltaproteobacteria bacterium]